MSTPVAPKQSKSAKYLGDAGPVRAGFELDEKALRDFLEENTDLDCDNLEIRQFKGGQSNPTYLLAVKPASYVLRRRPPGTLLASAHAVDREFRVLAALHKHGVAVPEPLVYCGDAGILGSEFYLMTHVPGRIFWDNALPDLTPVERAEAYDSANAALAKLHLLVPAEIGLEDFGRPGNYFGRQVARWWKQYTISKTDDIQEMEQVAGWLQDHVPDERPARIVHGDYSFHNLIFRSTESQVAAIIDWELATTGDPIADLTYHAMEWYRPPNVDPRGSLIDKDLTELGIPTLEAYVARYCSRVGQPAIENLGFYKAFNLFRVAAIIQGVVGRVKNNNAVNSDAQEQAARVRPLAQFAWREAQIASVG